MLVFPERVLKGDIPNRDFLHLYGPGQPVGAGRRVQGVRRLAADRAHLRLAPAARDRRSAIYALARRWGRTLAVCVRGRVGARSSSRSGSPRWRGSAAVGLGDARARGRHRSAAPARRPRRRAGGRSPPASCSASRCCSGSTSCSRSALSSIALVWGMRPARRNALLVALARRAVARTSSTSRPPGPGNVWQGMVIDPVFHLRGGRSLPIPPPWGAPRRLPAEGRRACNSCRGRSPRSRPRSSCSCGSSCCSAWSRSCSWQGWHAMPRRSGVDPRAHAARRRAVQPRHPPPGAAARRLRPLRVGRAACRSAFLPVALYEFAAAHGAARARRATSRSARARRRSRSLVFVLPAFTATRYADYALQTFGMHRHSYKIETRRPRLLLRQARPRRRPRTW